MTLATFEGIMVPPLVASTSLSAVGTIDASGEKIALIFQAPKTGNIDRVTFRTLTVTVGATLDIRVETLDPATGNPSGTLWGTNTNVSKLVNSTDDNAWIECTLTNAAAVTKGDFLAVVIVWGTGGNMGIVGTYSDAASVGNAAFPYTSVFTTAWTKGGGNGLILAVRYDDGTYPVIESAMPAYHQISASVHVDSSPDELGNKIVLPFRCRVSGAWHNDNASVNGNYQVVLYDESNTILTSLTVDAEYDSGSSTVNMKRLTFPSSVILEKDTVYRLVIKPTTTTTISLRFFSCHPSASMAGIPGGTAFVRTHRTDAGAWTDTSTERVNIGLIVDQFDDGTGEGGGGGSFEGWGVGI